MRSYYSKIKWGLRGMKKLAIGIAVLALIFVLFWIFSGNKRSVKKVEKVPVKEAIAKKEARRTTETLSPSATSLQKEIATPSKIVPDKPRNEEAVEIKLGPDEKPGTSDVPKTDASKNGPPEIKLDSNDNPIVDKKGNPTNL